MELQNRFLAALQPALAAEPHIKAAWLTGSLGRGNADRYSDIDLNLWLEEADLDEFRSGTQAWLTHLRPLVLFKWMFNNRMANVLTVDGLRLDLWLHSDPAPILDEGKVRVLLDRDNALQFGPSPATPDAAATQTWLLQQMCEFWRCIALTPTVIGRDERIISLVGLTVEVNILTDLLITGYGIARDSGVKRLNPFLPPALRPQIEAALALQGLTQAGLAQAHLALARIMQAEGRHLATRHGFAYPVELEQAVLDYVTRELAAIGIDVPTESEKQP